MNAKTITFQSLNKGKVELRIDEKNVLFLTYHGKTNSLQMSHAMLLSNNPPIEGSKNEWFKILNLTNSKAFLFTCYENSKHMIA